jgi:N-acetylmuramoyl-L-alanine amidase
MLQVKGLIIKQLKMSKKLAVIWDNGHGSTINGEYQTPGKRSPEWDQGVLYEGVANRWIVQDCIKRMDYARLPYYHVSPELEDIGLIERVNRANKIYEKNKNVYGISVHFNAGGGTGWEIFTSPGETKSDYIAKEFIDVFKDKLPLRARLGKGKNELDHDKEAKFTIIQKSKCPFILLECGFMDNPADYKLLWDPNFHNLLGKTIFEGIERVNEKYGK